MDTAEKFIANRTPKLIILVSVILIILSAAASAFVSVSVSGKIISGQIESCIAAYGGQTDIFDAPKAEFTENGSKDLKKYGIRSDMDPKISHNYIPLRNQIFLCIFIPSLSLSLLFCLMTTTAVMKHYSRLEKLREKCIDVSESRPVSGIMSIDDITSCTGRLDESISLISERLTHLTSQLNNERIFLREFLSDFSHQLKTSIAVMRLNTDLIDSMPDMDPEKYDELTAENQMHLDTIEDLVISSLKLAKMNADSVKYEMRSANAFDICKEAVRHVSGLARNKNISISLSGNETSEIYADRMWMREAVENIIKNSIDHAECDKIEVTVSESITSVTISVSDNGKGIPQEYIPKLFERFGKSSGSSVMSSTGIGMSIAEKIVHAHNGEILVFSELNKGTSFEIILLK